MTDSYDDHHEHHRMDTNGFGNHEAMHQQIASRFVKASLRFAEHMENGSHSTCANPCALYLHFIDLYTLYLASE